MSKTVNETKHQLAVRKLALGTVQFGLNYGINNKTGIIDNDSFSELLNFGFERGVDTLDTAFNYGNSEERIGKYLSGSNNDFKIISKAPKGSNSQNIKKFFQESIDKLNVDSIYGYMLHDFEDYLNDKQIINSLTYLKEHGFVEKIGFSLYHPEQLDILLKNGIRFELIQVPYNLADLRFENYFEHLKNINVEIHIRSVFLQGLFFMKFDELPEKLKPFKAFLEKLDGISKDSKRTTENIALNFAVQNENIDRVVIGVDNKEQLQKNLNEINYGIESETLLELRKELNKINISQELLMPSNWK